MCGCVFGRVHQPHYTDVHCLTFKMAVGLEPWCSLLTIDFIPPSSLFPCLILASPFFGHLESDAWLSSLSFSLFFTLFWLLKSWHIWSLCLTGKFHTEKMINQHRRQFELVISQLCVCAHMCMHMKAWACVQTVCTRMHTLPCLCPLIVATHIQIRRTGGGK